MSTSSTSNDVTWTTTTASTANWPSPLGVDYTADYYYSPMMMRVDDDGYVWINPNGEQEDDDGDALERLRSYDE